MSLIHSLFFRALLALTIAVGAPAAMAGPTYRVSLDTTALAGSTGYLDLGLNGPVDASPSMANISNFSGAFLQGTMYSGTASGNVESGVFLANGPEFNFFDQLVAFGGMFSFDVDIDFGNSTNGSLFSVAFVDDQFNYLGAAGNLIELNLVAGQPAQLLTLETAFASVAEVPEPGEWLLLATGLLLIVATRRMQQRG